MNMESTQTGLKSSPRFSIQSVINLLFVMIVFIVTRQVPFSFLSPLMNLAVISIITLSVYKNKPDRYSTLLIFFLLLIPLGGSLLYSIVVTDNNAVLAIKFFLVLVSVGLACFVHVDRGALKWFVRLCLLQAFIMLAIFLYLVVFMNMKSYLPIRFFFLERGWGDVYTYNGYFYRIQIKGSALMLIAFVLNLELKLFKRQYLVAAFLLLGVILAGNFAFLISLFIYFVYKIFSLRKIKSADAYLLRLLCIGVVSVFVMPFIYQYALSVIELKKDTSLGTRGDQFNELMKNLGENPFTILLGQGLGNTLDVKTTFRDYTGDTYFEIQILYVFNQLGVLFSCLFIAYNFLLTLKLWGRGSFILYFIYFIYITYAITNPYILDTNHVVMIIVLNSMYVILKKSNEYQQDRLGYRPLPA